MDPPPSYQNHLGQSRSHKPIPQSTKGLKYQPCRTMVFPPSNVLDGDPELNRLPDTMLELRFAHGYNGKDGRDNVWYLQGGSCPWCLNEHQHDEIVYFVAATGVVMDIETKRQRFFNCHDDDIVSLCVHPSRFIAATGQIGRKPKVCVWDAHTMQCLRVLVGFHDRYVNAMDFSNDGVSLITVGGDDQHSIAVYDWEKGILMQTAKGFGSPVYLCSFNRNSTEALEYVTCGEKHVKFWDAVNCQGKMGLMGKVGKTQNINCVTFANNGRAVTGCADGDIYFWTGGACVAKIVKAHICTTAVHWCESEGLISGGTEGHIAVWEEGLCTTCQQSRALASMNPTQTTKSRKEPPICIACFGRKRCIRDGRRWNLRQATFFATTLKSMDCTCKIERPCQGVLLLGTKTSEILLFNTRDGTVLSNLIQGHSAAVRGLCAFKGEPSIATCSQDTTVRIWDLIENKLKTVLVVGEPLCSIGVSPSGDFMVIGQAAGKVSVWARADTKPWNPDQLSNVGNWVFQSKPVEPQPTSPVVQKLRSLKLQLQQDEEGDVIEEEGETVGDPVIMPDPASFVSFAKSTAVALRSSLHFTASPSGTSAFAVMQDRKEDIDHVRFSPNGRYFAAGSRDNYIDIYEMIGNTVQRVGVCQGHSSFITRFDWSCASDLIQSCDASCELLFWIAPSGKQTPKSFDLRNIEWDSQSCLFGYNVKSIWPEGSSGNDINSVSVAASKKCVVVTDDNSHIKLFRFPCAGDRQLFRAYMGHSSHVPNSCFAFEDKYVATVGGTDQALLVWAHIPVDGPNDDDEASVKDETQRQEEMSEDIQVIAEYLERIAELAGKYKELDVVASSAQTLLAALGAEGRE